MASFLKGIMNKLGGGKSSRAPFINLGAFGKHPGWDDHIDDLGLESSQLINAKSPFLPYFAATGKPALPGGRSDQRQSKTCIRVEQVEVGCNGISRIDPHFDRQHQREEDQPERGFTKRKAKINDGEGR